MTVGTALRKRIDWIIMKAVHNDPHRSRTMSDETEKRPSLTEEQQAQLDRALSGYGAQGANGYDLSLIRENLRLTPTERLERLQAAVDFFAEIDRARVNKLPKID
jgi:hypothetical protein